MTLARLQLALSICAAILLAGCTKKTVQPPNEIFQKAQQKYTSLTSYSDEGETVAVLNGTTIKTTFTIKLARPNLYRIEWEQNSDSSFSTTKTKTQAVWSAGDGDFMVMADGVAKKQANQETALAGATGISGGAAATVPSSFFKSNWGNQLGGSVSGDKPQADEKIGDVDCYVFTSESKGRSRTIWIGKTDFLIHQVRVVTSAKSMKAMMDKAAKDHPEMDAILKQTSFTGVTSTETHRNIVVNPNLTAIDFAR